MDVGFPQVVVSLLEGYAEQLPHSPQVEPLPITIPHLKVIKTAIGVVLNLSLGYGELWISIRDDLFAYTLAWFNP